ncbi:MAG: nitrile hydratase accessory protein [Chloroflexi bacterium]|nr:nitrile hydratase accessory protein [Chloroflexota bacterium]
MAPTPDRQISNMPEEVELPRSNGELVFEAPWEGRAFGLAVALNEGGAYEWSEFVSQLSREIKADPSEEKAYYEKWLSGLAGLAVKKGLISEEELSRRTHEYETGERNDDDH